jgi:hypothetical protein
MQGSRNAEALARGTRTEVEATEKEALRLKEALADRVLNDDQIKSIADKMSKYVGQAYTFSAYRVPESTTIGGDIRQALQMAHWRFFGPEVRETKGGLVGISIDCHPDADKVTLDAVHDLNKVLWSEGLVVTEGIDPTISERNTIHIAIGTKR